MRKWQVVLITMFILLMAVPAFAEGTGESVWDQVIMAVLTLCGSAITGFLAWLTKKLTDWLKSKIKFLSEQTKNALQARIIDMVAIVTRETMQTYVDGIKKGRADGKLTDDEKKTALNMTFNKAVKLLKQHGIEIGEHFLTALIEATVNSIKGEKNDPGANPTPQ